MLCQHKRSAGLCGVGTGGSASTQDPTIAQALSQYMQSAQSMILACAAAGGLIPAALQAFKLFQRTRTPTLQHTNMPQDADKVAQAYQPSILDALPQGCRKHGTQLPSYASDPPPASELLPAVWSAASLSAWHLQLPGTEQPENSLPKLGLAICKAASAIANPALRCATKPFAASQASLLHPAQLQAVSNAANHTGWLQGDPHPLVQVVLEVQVWGLGVADEVDGWAPSASSEHSLRRISKQGSIGIGSSSNDVGVSTVSGGDSCSSTSPCFKALSRLSASFKMWEPTMDGDRLSPTPSTSSLEPHRSCSSGGDSNHAGKHMTLVVCANNERLITLVQGVVRQADSKCATVQVLALVPEQHLIRHHPGAPPSSIVLLCCELWDGGVQLSSRCLISLPPSSPSPSLSTITSAAAVPAAVPLKSAAAGDAGMHNNIALESKPSLMAAAASASDTMDPANHVATTYTQYATSALYATQAWWWGASAATVAAALSELQTHLCALASDELQDTSNLAAEDTLQDISKWAAHVAFVDALGVWLQAVRRMAISSQQCFCTGCMHADQLPTRSPLPPDAVLQLGTGLQEQATAAGLKQVQGMLLQQMRMVVKPWKEVLSKRVPQQQQQQQAQQVLSQLASAGQQGSASSSRQQLQPVLPLQPDQQRWQQWQQEHRQQQQQVVNAQTCMRTGSQKKRKHKKQHKAQQQMQRQTRSSSHTSLVKVAGMWLHCDQLQDLRAVFVGYRCCMCEAYFKQQLSMQLIWLQPLVSLLWLLYCSILSMCNPWQQQWLTYFLPSAVLHAAGAVHSILCRWQPINSDKAPVSLLWTLAAYYLSSAWKAACALGLMAGWEGWKCSPLLTSSVAAISLFEQVYSSAAAPTMAAACMAFLIDLPCMLMLSMDCHGRAATFTLYVHMAMLGMSHLLQLHVRTCFRATASNSRAWDKPTQHSQHASNHTTNAWPLSGLSMPLSSSSIDIPTGRHVKWE